MSQTEHAGTSSSKASRLYRKGKPLSGTERQQALIERRKSTHKEIRVYVKSSMKERLLELCELSGLTQAEMVELLIKNADALSKDFLVKE